MIGINSRTTETPHVLLLRMLAAEDKYAHTRDSKPLYGKEILLLSLKIDTNMRIFVFLALLSVSLAVDTATQLEVSQAAHANTQFGLELLKKVSVGNKNVFFSPYSISAAIAMTSLGAAGNTLTEIDHTFHFDTVNTNSDPKAIHKVYKGLIEDYNKPNSNYSLSTANRLFGSKNFEIKPTFQNETKYYYDAELQQVNFDGTAEGIINHWVENQTHDKIKDLFKAGSLTPDTALVLVNAIYFKGNWNSQFKKENTKDEDFHSADNTVSSVKMMNQKSRFNYYHDGTDLKCKVLEMPYVGKSLSMVILLPDTIDGLPNLVQALTAEKFEALLGKLFETQVDVKLPKFKLETEYSLKETLQQLGIHDLFSNSDLTGLSESSVQVSGVKHKAFVNTDEEGTEAAAATGVHLPGLPSLVPPTPQFFVDHSFLFAIVNNVADLNVLSETATSVSEVVHKAYIDVDEEGTEAAAATGIVITDANMSALSKNRTRVSSVIHKAFVDVDETGTEAAAATGIGVVMITAYQPPLPQPEANLTALSISRTQVSAVVHKAYVDVDETGTEAAAATAIAILGTNSVGPSPPQPNFHWDSAKAFSRLLRLIVLRHNTANLSALSGTRTRVSAVVHKAYVNVDEEGTEAAAATGVGIHTLAIIQSKEFFVDHPFYLVIKDLKFNKLWLAFASNSAANLTALSDTCTSVSTVVHKAYINVDEEGTEAAAATGVGIHTTAIQLPQQFFVDHPFYFVIRDLNNLSGIGEGPLKVSRIIHKAFVDVDEEGTEAAAATGVVAVPFSSSYQPQPTAQLSALPPPPPPLPPALDLPEATLCPQVADQSRQDLQAAPVVIPDAEPVAGLPMPAR
uniref:Serpin domain-containing protein n=1 Tax=Strigamia maritima TaxID=126957 RepID=T1ISI2_STRMM